MVHGCVNLTQCEGVAMSCHSRARQRVVQNIVEYSREHGPFNKVRVLRSVAIKLH